MQPDRQIGWFILQRTVNHAGINLRQLVRIVTPLTNLLTLLVGAQVSPDGVIQLQITTASFIKA